MHFGLDFSMVGGSSNGSFDPVQLNPIALWDLAPNSLFQDSAGTTPATSNSDPVGRVLDRSGNGNHLTQTSATLKPLLSINSGVRSLQFDGVDDFLDATGMTSPAGPKTFIVGCYTTDENDLFQHLFDAQTGRLTSEIIGGTAGAPGISDGVLYDGASFTSTVPVVMVFKHWASGGGIEVDKVVNLSQNVVERAIGGSAAIGARFDGGLAPLKGFFHSGLMYDKVLSPTEIENCVDWVAQKQNRII